VVRLACHARCAIVALANRSLEDRCVSKPYIIERKPSRKPKPDALKPSIWGKLDTDIAQGLQDQRDREEAAATGVDDRA